MTDDAVQNKDREFCHHLAIDSLRTKKEKDTFIHSIIEKTDDEALREMGKIIIQAHIACNPQLYREVNPGRWALRNPPQRPLSD